RITRRRYGVRKCLRDLHLLLVLHSASSEVLRIRTRYRNTLVDQCSVHSAACGAGYVLRSIGRVINLSTFCGMIFELSEFSEERLVHVHVRSLLQEDGLERSVRPRLLIER